MSFGFSRVNARFALAFVIIALIWLGNPTQSFAQKFSAEDLEMQIGAEIVNRNWAKVLELARTQIWLDVDKAVGYYYSALAHIEIGNRKMAKPFLSEAKRLDDGKLEMQIAALEQSLWDKKKKSSQSEFIPIRSMDRVYYALTYSPEIPLGFHLGSLNTHGIGTYFLLRTNPAFLQKKAEFTVNNQGTVYGSPYAKTEATGQVKTGMAELLMGLTWKIAGPVWMFGGVGLNHSREYWEMEILDENSNYIGQVWVRNQQSNLNQPTVETGLMGDFRGINIRLGSSLTNFDLETVRFHFGLGFSLRKK
jgi:hypothetical protein